MGYIVQSPAPTIDDSGTNSTTIAQTLPGVTLNNLMLAIADWADPGNTITASCADGQGTYGIACGKVYNTTDQQSSAVFILVPCVSGSHASVVTFSTTTSYRRIRLVEIAGIVPVSSIDQTVGNFQIGPGFGLDAVTSGASPALTWPSDFVLGICIDSSENTPGTGTLTAGTGYTLWDSNLIVSVEYKNVAGFSPQTATWTRGGTNSNNTSFVLALKNQPPTSYSLTSSMEF
jgi:hypothetical protein